MTVAINIFITLPLPGQLRQQPPQRLGLALFSLLLGLIHDGIEEIVE